MATRKTILVEGSDIALLPLPGAEDYISLTDIMRRFDDEFAIYGWLRNRNTVEFLGVWEQLHNPVFKPNEFVTFKNQAGANNFNLTPKKWIDATGAIGLVVKAGRHGGGTFAHRDIAVNFCYWLSPTFQLYLIKEFQRLKEAEAEQSKGLLDWNLKRTLAKVNYRIHTDTVRLHLVPPRIGQRGQEGMVYANEADLLNLALFGITARQWKEQNPGVRGNLRDFASAEQLLVLANLESHNAQFIREGLSHDERLHKLNEIAIYQMELLANPAVLNQLKSLPDGSGQ